MGINQFGEKLNQFKNTSIRNGQMLSKINTDVTKKLSELNSSLVNHVAKDIQISAVDLMNSKKLSNPLSIMKLNGNESFVKEFENYQQHLNDAINDYFEEFASANEQLLEDSRDAYNEFVQLTCQNVPDGMDTFIKPYQTIMGSWFESAAIVNGLSKSYLENVKKGLSGNSKNSKSVILSQEEGK